MSLRNIRKVFGEPSSLPPPGSDGEDDYEPLYARRPGPSYQGLVLSSHSETEEAKDSSGTDVDEPPNNKKKKKKQKRKRKNRKWAKAYKEILEMDEIERSVMEVNAMLGTPEAAPVPPEPEPVSPTVALFSLEKEHLNVAYETKRLFGTGPMDKKDRNRRANMRRLLRKPIIIPIPENIFKLTKIGLTMSISRRTPDAVYFVIDHSLEYQRAHRTLLRLNYVSTYAGDHVELPGENLIKDMHVEAILAVADAMFKSEQHLSGNKMIEQIIGYLQYIAPPPFSMTDRRTRLEYVFLENRPFLVAMLKYAYLLSNRACHRTGLELAKLLLQLDPTDPLAVLFIIDTFALRAREHQWLIDAIDYWRQKRDAKYLFNLQYSYALAKYHVAMKNEEPMETADEILQEAIVQFPTVVLKILEGMASSRLLSHPLYNVEANATTTNSLSELMHLYAKLTWSRWHEPEVLEWLKRNAEAIADKYDRDTEVEKYARDCGMERLTLFRAWPDEIQRHIGVIKPMSELLVEGAVPVTDSSCSFDPFPPPPTCFDRYSYRDQHSPTTTSGTNYSLLELFYSILPHYRYRDVPPEEIERVLAPDPPREPRAMRGEGVDDSSDDDEAGDISSFEFMMSLSDLTDAVRQLLHEHEESQQSHDQARDQPQLPVAEPLLSDADPLLSGFEPELSDIETLLSDPEPELSDPEPQLPDPEPQLSDAELLLSDSEPELSDAETLLPDDQPQLTGDCPPTPNNERQPPDDERTP